MRYELLEPRHLMAAEIGFSQSDTAEQQNVATTSITWFETVAGVERVPLASLASVDRLLPAGVAGPIPLATGEWVTQLTKKATKDLDSIADLNVLFQTHSDQAIFNLIKGLGSEGLILIRAQGASRVDIEAALESIVDIEHFGLNQLIHGQDVIASDTDFVRGAMPSLDLIGMPRAWQESIGSLNTVVGVLDTGIDLAHPDLYLNIWLNQGEIPQRFFSEDGTLLLTDIDGDGLITFYDLNHATRSSTAPFELTVAGYQNGPNRDYVIDINGNGYIDAYDILADPLWADGRDTDGNGEVDDFFGLNLRGEGFAPNNPIDTQGHGTHVAGTIGAVGGNSAGVTGINWQVSLMPLRILDSSNQGDTGSALRAVNYAKSMRERYEVDANGRVVQGANVRVLNNSWGQPGGYEQALETAITRSGEAGILFVAASGNGNFLGQGVDNDRTPFYPASYNSPNIIAVAASTLDDQLAPFSNFGNQAVDIAAPGVGIRSTEPGGGYGTRNGTSMATPHVSGAAALIQSVYPHASVDEVKAAILTSVAERVNFDSLLTGGRLNVASALQTDEFAPFVTLLSKQDIAAAGGTGSEFTVAFSHPSGIDPATVGDGDFVVTRQWGPEANILATLREARVSENGQRIEATYFVAAPGGIWDPMDFGHYAITSVANEVRSIGGRGIRAAQVGDFSVRIEDASFIYVETFEDVIGMKSLRDALIEANAAAPAHRTIILADGMHRLSIPPVVDPESTFPLPDATEGALTNVEAAIWSGELTGDLDVFGNVTIFGDRNDQTIIDAGGIDRVFKVHPGATLILNRITIQGGVAPVGQGGGGILSQGTLVLNQTTVRENQVQSSSADNPLGGGGIAAWNGTLTIDQSWIDQNQSEIGAGVFVRGNTSGSLRSSTVSNQVGGGLYSLATTSFVVNNSTFSDNIGGNGAIFSKIQGVIRPVPPPPPLKTRSDDGRFTVVAGVLNMLVPEDTNGFSDVYVYDSLLNIFELASVTSDGELANGPSDPSNVAYISSDGRYVVFESKATNLVPNDTNESQDVFIRDRLLGTTTRVSVNSDGQEADADVTMQGISNDAKRILFTSRATNLGPGGFGGQMDLYLHDVQTGTTTKITQSDNSSFGVFTFRISGDGSTIAYSSQRRNIVPDDTNNSSDVFVFDVETGLTERVSIATDGTQASGNSYVSAISDSGRFVYFSSDAIELDPASPIVGVGEFVRDRNLNQTFLRSAPADAASIFASQVTIFDSRVIDEPIVSGRVTLDNALLAVRNPRPLGDQVTTTNVIGPERFGVLRVSPLVATDNEPPVHELLIDNPAINSGTLRFQVDQRGQARGEFPDVGAVEAISGSIEGTLFIDLNGNQRRDLNEPGVANVLVRASTLGDPLIGQARTSVDDPTTPDIDENGMFRFTSLRNDIYQFVFDLPDGFRLSQSPIEEIRRSLEPIALSRDGTAVAFSSPATNLVAGDRNGKQDIFFLDRATNAVQRISRGLMGAEPNGDSSQPSISADGRFVAYTSKATNLAVSDDEGFDDVFLFDRVSAETTRISVGSRDLLNRNDIGGIGDSHSPMISPDGTFITFVSSAPNFSFDDSNGNTEDVFVYDIARDNISLVSDFLLGDQGIAARSFEPVISAGGRVVAFATDATDYQHRQAARSFDDLNVFSDVVLFRKPLGGSTDSVSEFRLVSQGLGGVGANGNSHSPSIDTAGNTIAFVSDANNLVSDDANGVSDIFVLRQTSASQTELIRLVPDRDLGIEADGPSHSPSISGDGRFVTFVSRATNWVSGQSNDQDSIYVYSLEDGRVRRLSETVDGQAANGSSRFPVFSFDGRFISFSTTATNLFVPSTPQLGGSVVVPNPLIESSVSFEIRAGQQLSNLSFGLLPDSGTISGKVFVDELVPNLRHDLGEEVLSGVGAFLDLNRNNRLDPGEPRTITDENGQYRFDNVPALRELAVVVGSPQGFEQVAPESRVVPGFTLTLPAGGILSNLDIGFRLITTTGQSSDSTIRGRVMIDSNGNGVIDEDDTPASGRVVYMDGGTPGVRDFNDPQAVTDADGYYEFTGLPATISPLRVLLDETLEQTSPVGSSFALQKFPLQDIEKRGGNPQAVITADFNDDGFPDVAVVLADTNTLSIRLNDGRGGFTSRKIDLNLNDLAGGANRFLQPTAIVAGNFDTDGRIDVALTGNFSSSVLILRNFDEESGTFVSTQVVDVGLEPLDLVAGNFGGNNAIDLVVLLKGENQLRVLTNDGTGVFTAGPGIATGGVLPSSIVTADFNKDDNLDVAVTHTVTSLSDTTAGRVTILLGNGNGGLSLSPLSYTVQASPTDAAVGDFNGDGRPDLAVVNFASNSISVLLGRADGSMRVQTTTLGTTQGAVDIAVADIDNDGDVDILVTKLQQREVAIFRNIGTVGDIDGDTNDVRFEPQESIGLGRFSFAERAPFALANLDKDTSGPNGTGTIDIIAVPQNTDTLFVLHNTLVQGARRAAVSGARSDIADNVDFLLRPAILPPSFAFQATPLPIAENSPEQTVRIVNITKGRPTGPALRFSATSSNPELIADPIIMLSEDGTQATLRYTPTAGMRGTTEITVRAVDAGANGEFGDPDDAVFEQSFTATVLEVVQPIVSSVIFRGEGERFDMASTPNVFVSNITLIDIRGTGSNSLVLDLNKISQFTPGRRLTVIADNDDVVTFGAGWTAQMPEFIDGKFTHVITAMPPAVGQVTANAGGDGDRVRVELRNNRPLQNPLQMADVDRDAAVQPLDALRVLIELRLRGAGPIAFPTSSSEISPLYFDVTGDNILSPLDALQVLNAIAGRNRSGSSGEGETLAATPQIGFPHAVPLRDSSQHAETTSASGESISTDSRMPRNADTLITIGPNVWRVNTPEELGNRKTDHSSDDRIILIDEVFADKSLSEKGSDPLRRG